MDNRTLAKKFQLLAKIMELHGENPFKIRSYQNAYNTLRRHPDEVANLPREELMEIKGFGKNIADKIKELTETRSLATLERYLDITPPGIVDLLGMKGLGPKKIKTIWEQLGIESAGELLYACEENRLSELKGFGAKTQENLKEQLIYFLDAQGKYLYGHIIEEATDLLDQLQSSFAKARFDFINDVRRQMPIVESIDILGTADYADVFSYIQRLDGVEESEAGLQFKGTFVNYEETTEESYENVLWEGSASSDWLDSWEARYPEEDISSEDDVRFDRVGSAYIPPESREDELSLERALDGELDLITHDDIRGVVHNHTTYSDGANTLRQMAAATQELGYDYLVITDHSQSAFYAGGLKEDDLVRQINEIHVLNQEMKDFTVFSGTESDILSDGSLDYPDDLLMELDVVIASVHSQLKMDIAKATKRLIKAISHPATKILGHATGRLLLSRKGYPIDHAAVIDACADYGVSIELNANPYRLDLDWTWIPYAVEKGVLISINPDAHNIKGISDIRYGVSAARKALLRPSECLNTFELADFKAWVQSK